MPPNRLPLYRWRTRMNGDTELSAVSYRLSAIGCQLSAISYQLSAVGYRLSAFSFQLSAFSYQLAAVSEPRGDRRALRAFSYTAANSRASRARSNIRSAVARAAAPRRSR